MGGGPTSRFRKPGFANFWGFDNFSLTKIGLNFWDSYFFWGFLKPLREKQFYSSPAGGVSCLLIFFWDVMFSRLVGLAGF